jgi:hypothetical protein
MTSAILAAQASGSLPAHRGQVTVTLCDCHEVIAAGPWTGSWTESLALMGAMGVMSA